MIRHALIVLALTTPVVPHSAAADRPKGEWQLATFGERTNDNYGFSISTAGDFDHDGYEDLIVGSIFDDTLAPAAGRAEILFGGPSPDARAPLSLFGDRAAHDHFGVAVTGGGDLDGDGHDDVAVGARFNDRGAADAGAVFVFFGGPDFDAVADLVLAGVAANDWFGQSLAIIPDIDGDGDAELLVGAPFHDGIADAAGCAWLFRGGAPMDAEPDIECRGDAVPDAQFGWSVAAAGDFDADGSGDWIVGARHWGDPVGAARGRAYVFLGGPTADGLPDRMFSGERADDWFAHSVAGVGDVDGDGFDDIAAGAIFWDAIAGEDVLSAAGRVYVFGGGVDAAERRLATVDGTTENAQMGFSLSRIALGPGGRPSGWLGGARFADGPSGAAAGEIRISRLDPSGDVRTVSVSRGDAADDQWGHAVAGLGAMFGATGAPSFAGAAVYNDEHGGGAGKVERATPGCIDVTFPSRDEIDWHRCAGYARFGLLRRPLLGDVAEWVCLAAATAPPFPTDDLPAPGNGWVYLVIGEGADGRTAAAGYDSRGQPRDVPSCP